MGNNQTKGREIKFRAWARRGEWDPNGEKQKFIMLGADVLAFEEYAPISELLTDIEDDFYLMQYTGLQDRNGAEIYEGDVVRNDNNSHLEVFWNELTHGWWFASREFGEPYHVKQVQLHSLEVIGNIYENPELLAKAKA